MKGKVWNRKQGCRGSCVIALLCLFCVLGWIIFPASVEASGSSESSEVAAESGSMGTMDASEAAASPAAEQRTVRVGFYPAANFQEIHEDGTYSGFNYDYYLQMQKYTRWDYELVEASYSECMEMLLNGEIDIMGGVGKTSERESQMYFCNYSVANSQNKLYAKADNENLFYESFDTFDGCKIAMIRGVLTEEVEQYCENNGFQAEIVFYNSLNDMTDALMAEDVDMICSSSIASDLDTKIVARMDKQPLYFVSSLKDPEIIQEMNLALHRIVDNNPDFYNQLAEKYMLSGANATATFTREEISYIETQPKLYVIVNPQWAPITWYDSEAGEYRGIVVDIIKRLEAYSGLKFELCTEAEFNALEAENPELENNVMAILADDSRWASMQTVMMSNHVVDSSVVMVGRRGKLMENLSEDTVVAMPKRFYIGYIMQEELTGKVVVEYDTVQECLDAVNHGKADVTYVNELVATYYLSMLEYSNLYAMANTGYFENLAFAVNKESNLPLLSILDKSLLCIGSSDINQIVVQNSIAEERFSLNGLYYTNPQLFISSIVILVMGACAIFLAIYFTLKKRRVAEVELRKEEEINNARAEFFMMISHELRTPLNAVVGYLNLVAEEHRRNHWEMEYVKRSQNAANQLTDIAADMLDYTKIASHSLELKEEIFDLKDVIRNVDQNISLKAVEKDLTYQISVANMAHEYVVGDHLRVTQVFQNILSNGVKFTEPGGRVEANIREELLEDGRLKLIFTCKDTGKGMEEAFTQKVCAPFKQSDKSYSRTHGGLGLGLYLTKYFVDSMGGELLVESKVGEGSCFTVSMFLRSPNSEQILQQSVDCSHVRAIVCGTDPEDNTHLKELLKRLKMKCDTVTDGEKLIRRLRSRQGGEYAYSLCILDDTTVKPDGEILDQMKEALPETTHFPMVFVLTSESAWIDRLEADQRVERVLYKPIFQSVLFDAVMDTFGEYRPEEEEELPDFSGIHGMIVEDNMVNADILSRILRKVKMDITFCSNGKEAVEAFEGAKENAFQIIFMDIQMPVMNGYDAAKAIRTSVKIQGKEIPIVAVSANAFPEDIARSMEAGMNEHLSKPVSERVLYEVIEKFVKNS